MAPVPEDAVFVEHAALLAFARDALGAVGADDWSRDTVAEALVTASLRGTDSHGVRLLSGYCNAANAG